MDNLEMKTIINQAVKSLCAELGITNDQKIGDMESALQDIAGVKSDFVAPGVETIKDL